MRSGIQGMGFLSPTNRTQNPNSEICDPEVGIQQPVNGICNPESEIRDLGSEILNPGNQILEYKEWDLESRE